MSDFGFRQTQSISQVQRQVMSQVQIYALNMLSLNRKEIQSEVNKVVNENPALEIVHRSMPFENTRLATSTRAGEEMSEKYREAYESSVDTRETLQEHLLSQLNMIRLSEDEKMLGEALIRNLDKNGYHLFAPISLLDQTRPLQTESMLNRLIRTIQNFEPEGTCCNNLEESLYVQALQRGNAPELALFILNGNLKILYSTSESPDLEKIKLTLEEIQAKQNLSYHSEKKKIEQSISIEKIKEAIAFISKLNPHPAQEFGTDFVQYVSADVIVEKEDGSIAQKIEDGSAYIPIDESSHFKLSLAPESFPELRVNPSFKKQNNPEVKKYLNAAQRFINMIEYRKDLVLQACTHIVLRQLDFFLSEGSSYLEMLSRKELAEKFSVHVSTVARLANEKYIRSPWGQLYPIKFFFTNEQNKAKFLLKQIIQNSKNRKKEFSDRELKDILASYNVSVSRRTVAKYRAALDIASSYER